jgi:hypothetical protein
MSELAQGSISFLAVILTACAAWIQMRGGRPGGRIYYRLFFPLFFSISLIGVSLISGMFQWTYLLFLPLYMAISTLGHTHFHERLIECWCYGLPSVLIVWNHTELCTFLTLQMLILAPTAAVIGHYFNQKTAPRIEFLVNFLRVVLVMYMVS